jgi:hypothetical protein
MKAIASSTRVLALLLTGALFAPCAAQIPAAPPSPRATPPPSQPRTQTQATPPQVASQTQPTARAPVTFDTLLAADAYAVYGEFRGVGAYINSKEVAELVAPLSLPGTGAPPEALDLYNFLKAHAEVLATARVLFAASPARAKLPDGVAAVDLSSPEQAQKFETELRQFLNAHADVLTGNRRGSTLTLENDDARAPGRAGDGATSARRSARRGEGRASDNRKNAAPYYLRRAGALLVLSNAPFSLAALRPADAPLLADEPGFQAARARFAHETLFVYFNTKRMGRYTELQREKYEREAKRQEAAMRRAQRRGRVQAVSRADAPSDDETNADSRAVIVAGSTSGTDAAGAIGAEAGGGKPGETSVLTGVHVETTIQQQPPPPDLPTKAEPTPTPETQKELTPEERERVQQQQAAQRLFATVPSILFGNIGGGIQWPESIAVAGELTSDELIVRALVLDEAGDENRPLRPLPFVPLLLSGPALTAEAANVVPADTDVLLSASLDLPQMYDYVASMLKLLDLGGRKEGNESFEGQLSAFEKTSGFRLKDDLIAALGNEIAVAVPGRFLGVGRGSVVRAANTRASWNGPVFLIALNDKRALQALLPRALESVGLKGIREQQLIERRGDVELLTFTNGAVAFIDRFLVLAPDAETMRRVTDAYNERRTLANSDAYRNAGRWQPRQTLGQVYVANDLVKGLFDDPKLALEDVEDAQVRDVLSRVNADPGSVTYALTKDDQGLLHELHVPQNVLALISADALISQQLGPLRSHEMQAQTALREIAYRELSYREKHGRYGSLEDLRQWTLDKTKAMAEKQGAENLAISDSMLDAQAEGYDIKLNASGDKFEVTATPTVYRKTGRRSFYIAQDNVLRGADLNGKPADANAPPVD